MTGREMVTARASMTWIESESVVLLNRSSRSANCPILIPKAILPWQQAMLEVPALEDSEDARACPL